MAIPVKHYDGNDRFKTFSHSTGGTGNHWLAGQYTAPVADSNLTQASLTQTLGTADIGYGSHVFIVAAGVGSTDGSDLVITVTGTSVTDAGVRSAADSEVIVADATAAATNEYFESAKKWIGIITYTLSSTGGSTFDFDFNYGWAKYEDMVNTDFTVNSIDTLVMAGANDSSFDIVLYKHDGTGWSYHATAFVPGGTVLAQMTADFVTEVELANGEQHAWRHTGLDEVVAGSGSEGIVIKMITGLANSVDAIDIHLGYIQ